MLFGGRSLHPVQEVWVKVRADGGHGYGVVVVAVDGRDRFEVGFERLKVESRDGSSGRHEARSG